MDKKEAVKLCMCGKCPSYIECKEEIAFCLSTTGKSKCIKEEKGLTIFYYQEPKKKPRI